MVEKIKYFVYNGLQKENKDFLLDIYEQKLIQILI